MTFGGYDLAKFASGPVNWHYISWTSMYWELNLDKFEYTLGSVKRSIVPNEGIIVDSGTSYILMPF